MNPGCRAKDYLNTSEPTAPYVKAREINIWTCEAIGESNPGPFARAASGLTTGPPRPQVLPLRYHHSMPCYCYSSVVYQGERTHILWEGLESCLYCRMSGSAKFTVIRVTVHAGCVRSNIYPITWFYGEKINVTFISVLVWGDVVATMDKIGRLEAHNWWEAAGGLRIADGRPCRQNKTKHNSYLLSVSGAPLIHSDDLFLWLRWVSHE